MTEQVIETPILDARASLVETWKQLPAPLKIAGYAIFFGLLGEPFQFFRFSFN